MQAQATEGKTKTTPGIEVRHSRFCPSRNGGVCNAGRKGGCEPLYLQWVYSPRDEKKLRPEHGFRALAAAKRWRNDALGQVQRGQLQEQTRKRVRTVGDEWLEGAKQHALRVSELRRREVQALADRLRAQGPSASRIRNALLPLRVICRELIRSDELVANPTMNLRPSPTSHRPPHAETPRKLGALALASLHVH
jgi:hypothetical protein